ncbi:AzlD domain-containing protein [Photobacterium leiognathi]
MTLNVELIIVLMTVITFSCRYAFFMTCLPVRLNHTTKKILEFTAPS